MTILGVHYIYWILFGASLLVGFIIYLARERKPEAEERAEGCDCMGLCTCPEKEDDKTCSCEGECTCSDDDEEDLVKKHGGIGKAQPANACDCEEDDDKGSCPCCSKDD